MWPGGGSSCRPSRQSAVPARLHCPEMAASSNGAGPASPTQMASSQADAAKMASSQAGAKEVVSQGAKRALSMSKGVTRVPLEDLGPAVFNRKGNPTSGRHCVNLAKRILRVEGFGTFRYVAGYCHEPDPTSPLAVYHHANRMAERDPLLPTLPPRDLKGVFAKTHLMTMLQLYKLGRFPDLERVVSSQPEAFTRELKEALSQGIFMHVFPFEAIRDYPEDFNALMASDNFDHGHGLADSEIRCIREMRTAIRTLPLGEASSQFAAVSLEIQRLAGQRWGKKDLEAFWDFAQTTLELHMELLFEIWVFGECEDALQVDSFFFGNLAKLSASRQWTRAAVAVRQFLSDRDTECMMVAGRYLASAVDKNTLKRLASPTRTAEQKALSHALEAFIGSVMDTYYVPWAGDWGKSPFQRSSWAKGFAAFLCKMGRQVCKDLDLPMETKEKFETKLRATLVVDMHGTMPPAVIQHDSRTASSQEHTAIEMETILEDTANPGKAVVPAKRLASEAGLVLDGTVAKKAEMASQASSQDVIVVGTITNIDKDGVRVRWAEGKPEELHKHEDLVPAQRPKEKASVTLPEPALKWAPCSSKENADMWVHVAQSVLYQTYVSQSSAHAEVHVAMASSQGGTGTDVVSLFAARDLKPRALVLLPFNIPLVSGDETRPSGAVQAIVTVSPSNEAPASTVFWIRPKVLPRKTLTLAHGEKALTIVPFWVAVARASSQGDAKNLVYATAIVQIREPPPVSRGVRVQKGKMTLKAMCLTNEAAIPRGTLLMVADKPPTDLPMDNVMGVAS